MINDTAVEDFRASVRGYYQDYGRHDLPWRAPDASGQFDPYKILVSEVMLQQTQVVRVIPKYHEFLRRFPSIQMLADAELGEVLRTWSGLGYNRRAKFLHEAAKCIASEYNGNFPKEISQLVKLPGIGVNTAGAIVAYAFNQPVAFLETNTRTVYIYHFFRDQMDVTDKEILDLVAQTLDQENPREWYWALMDYGSYLKQTAGNLNKLSKHYSKQSKFEGSQRQTRGHVLRLLGLRALTYEQLAEEITDPRLEMIVNDLLREGLITQRGQRLAL
jgi:A/G-specific adenine glycosylase